MLLRVLHVIRVAQLLLHGLAVGADHEARFLLARSAADAHEVASDLHGAFRAGEDQAFALISAIDEVHAECEVKSLRIVEQPEHHVVGIAAIFPEAKTSGCHGASRSGAAGDEVRAAEEVNEEITGDSGAVSFPLAPLKEMF